MFLKKITLFMWGINYLGLLINLVAVNIFYLLSHINHDSEQTSNHLLV